MTKQITAHFVLIVLAGALVAGTVFADFVEVSVTSSVITPNTTTYQLWATFDSFGDQLVSVGGNPDVRPLEFAASVPLVNNGGAFAGMSTEDLPGYPVSGLDDSWLTIGGAGNLGDNDTQFTPGFLGSEGSENVVKGSSFSSEQGNWFDPNPGSEPTSAVTGPPLPGTLIAQFTIPYDASDGPGSWGLSGTITYQQMDWKAQVGIPSEQVSVPFWVGVAVAGDANGDGKVDGADLAVWQQYYDPLGGNPANDWGKGDWNDDGKIDGADLALWQQHYDPLGSGMAAVPEPATLSLLGLAGLILLRRKSASTDKR